MALKATNRRKIRVEYQDSFYVFTVRFLSRDEMAAVKARRAEVEAVKAASEAKDVAALEGLQRSSGLVELVDQQTADIILRVDVELGERTEPAVFDLGAGRELTWEQMTPEERVQEVADTRSLFHSIWSDIAAAAGGGRILGK